MRPTPASTLKFLIGGSSLIFLSGAVELHALGFTSVLASLGIAGLGGITFVIDKELRLGERVYGFAAGALTLAGIAAFVMWVAPSTWELFLAGITQFAFICVSGITLTDLLSWKTRKK